MDELIARIEAASGPDRELDKEILTTFLGYRDIMGGGTLFDRGNDGYWNEETLPSPTGSIDAALALVPDGMLWMVTNTGVDDPHKPDFSKATAVVADWQRSASDIDDRSAATPALALCAAALRARAA